MDGAVESGRRAAREVLVAMGTLPRDGLWEEVEKQIKVWAWNLKYI